MHQYKNWRPSAHDTPGLNLPEHQNWFVLPVMRTRDSPSLDESNFVSALKTLGGESDTCIVARFGHWGPGWIEIILLSPEREAEGDSIADSLEDYPILDESDFGERECELEFECWPNYGADEMIHMLVKNFELSQVTEDFLWELDGSSNGALRELHSEHSGHNYEMDDQGANYDFCYIDPKYAHWPDNLRLSRDALAAFICEQRRAKKSQEKAARK